MHNLLIPFLVVEFTICGDIYLSVYKCTAIHYMLHTAALERYYTWSPIYSSPQLARRRVDYFKPGRTIPHCQLTAKYLKEEASARELHHLLTLDGAREPNNVIAIEIDPKRHVTRRPRYSLRGVCACMLCVWVCFDLHSKLSDCGKVAWDAWLNATLPQSYNYFVVCCWPTHPIATFWSPSGCLYCKICVF